MYDRERPLSIEQVFAALVAPDILRIVYHLLGKAKK